MNREITTPLLLACCFLALFGLAEFLYHKRKVKAELTRKLVHAGTGMLTLLFPILLNSHWQVLFLCGSFLIILLISLKYHLLPSINKIDRPSHGSILFPVAVYGCYLLYLYAHKDLIMFYLPILTLAICDPIAALVGKRYPFGKFRIGESKKTLSGSLAFFSACFLVTISCFYIHSPSGFTMAHALPVSVLLSTTTAAAEAVSARGTDNITIPACVAAILSLI